MKKQVLYFVEIFSLMLLSIISYSQIPQWVWAKSAGGSNDDQPWSIAADASGSTYITGRFYSPTITFGSITLTNVDNTGTTCDLFLVKYDNNGNVLWAKSTGGTGNDLQDMTQKSIAVSASGNIYVTGSFQSPNITFGSFTLTNVDNTGTTGDLFLAKYDANGDVLWAKSAGGTDNDGGLSVAVDGSGNIYVAGYFYSGTFTIGSETLMKTGSAWSCPFLAKYDANGNVLWAKSAVADWAYNPACSDVVDASGNIYVAGMFWSSTITLGSITLTNNGNGGDLFLAKYDANGNVLWAQSAGGPDQDGLYSIALDVLGNTYLTGFFYGPSITFGSTTLMNTSAGGSPDIFLAKYNADGNVLWAKSAGGSVEDYAYSIAVDTSGNTYVTGRFNSPTITFGSNTLTNVDNTGTTCDVFLANYDANGNAIWVKSAGGSGDDWASSVAVDASGNIYVTGLFNSSTLVIGSTTLTNGGFYDMFLAKIGRNLDLTVFLQSLYAGGGIMNQAYDDMGPHFGPGIADQVTVELHNALNYATIEYTSGLVNLSTSGNISISVPASYSGSYYITIRHRNSIETISALPVSFAAPGTISYDFTIAATQAFGDNQKYLLDGHYGIWRGDVNQDGIVDSGDMNPVDNASTAVTFGYVVEDVNGDGIVDAGDMNIVDNNSTAVIMAITPP